MLNRIFADHAAKTVTLPQVALQRKKKADWWNSRRLRLVKKDEDDQ